MINKINKKTLFLVLLLAILVVPIFASAQGNVACQFLKSVSNGLYVVSGTIVIIAWLVAGIIYLSSFGSPEKMGVAKKAIQAAIIGTILVVLAASLGGVIANLLNSQWSSLQQCQ